MTARRSALRAFTPRWQQELAGPAGRAALLAGLLLLGALALVGVLEPHWRAEAAALDARRPPPAAQAEAPAWPEPAAHAARVSAVMGLAQRHGLRVRGLREDAAPAAPAAGVAWRAVALSAEGRYADLRGFAASALASDAALALDSLVLQRADASQGLLKAEFGFAFGHAADAAAALPRPARGGR
jgi:hypothetical protein